MKSDITHEKLLKLGFRLYGVEEDDPFYKIIFRSPFKFGVRDLSGVLDEEGSFWLYANDKRYADIHELQKVINMVGSEIYKFD